MHLLLSIFRNIKSSVKKFIKINEKVFALYMRFLKNVPPHCLYVQKKSLPRTPFALAIYNP